jgi:hypothetical protein
MPALLIPYSADLDVDGMGELSNKCVRGLKRQWSRGTHMTLKRMCGLGTPMSRATTTTVNLKPQSNYLLRGSGTTVSSSRRCRTAGIICEAPKVGRAFGGQATKAPSFSPSLSCNLRTSLRLRRRTLDAQSAISCGRTDASWYDLGESLSCLGGRIISFQEPSAPLGRVTPMAR